MGFSGLVPSVTGSFMVTGHCHAHWLVSVRYQFEQLSCRRVPNRWQLSWTRRIISLLFPIRFHEFLLVRNAITEFFFPYRVYPFSSYRFLYFVFLIFAKPTTTVSRVEMSFVLWISFWIVFFFFLFFFVTRFFLWLFFVNSVWLIDDGRRTNLPRTFRWWRTTPAPPFPRKASKVNQKPHSKKTKVHHILSPSNLVIVSLFASGWDF